MTGDSRTDLEALRRSGKGKILALALLLIAALGAATWFLLLKAEGIGAAERADKVLVVRSGEIAGYSAVLVKDGFDAAEGGLQHWVDKARSELPEPPQGSDVQIVLTLADHFGYGYVVFERPQDVDFSSLEIDDMPPLDEHVRFAAVSVGDFAFPHVVTVNPEPPKALRRVEVSLLQALFAQQALAEALPDNASASVAAIQLRSKLKEALLDLALVETAEALAEEVLGQARRQLQDERGASTPVLLSDHLEAGSAHPTPEGPVLSFVRPFDVVTEDGIRAELSPGSYSAFVASTPGIEGRVPLCAPALSEALEGSHSPRFVVDPGGGAFVVQRTGSEQHLWVATPATECGYTNLGAMSATTLDEVQLMLPHRSGVVAQVGTVDGEAAIEFTKPGEDAPRVVVLTGIGVRDVAWIDDSIVAATGDDGLLYLVSTAPQTPVVSVQPQGLGRDPVLFEVAARTDRSVLLTVGSSIRRLVRLDADRTWTALMEDPPALEVTPPDAEAPTDPEAPAAEVPGPVRLDPSTFAVKILTRAGKVTEPVASADGAAVAMTVYDRTLDDPGKGDDAEIGWISAEGGPLRLLTRNAVPDHAPSFTADGSAVLFSTRIELERSSWRLSVPRSVAVEP